ncbi:MAG: class I SAM-dependent methyltransferase [Candidatus Acidiferrales bacterium]
MAYNLAEASVIEANVQFYREIAAKYDRYETCVSDPGLQQLLIRDLDRIAILLGKRDGSIECLDCGGGSGNLSLKMLKRGWSVTVVDISADMLAILETKVKHEGYAPRLINESVTSFLSTTEEKYDVVTFSSVLHHLYSYLPVVVQATDHLKREGIFYSNFDPVVSRHPSVARSFEVFDTVLAKLMYDRTDFFPGVSRRIQKLFWKNDDQHGRPVVAPGDLAEYHARSGVDDLAIIQYLDKNGFSVREHLRWSSGRTLPTRFINRRMRVMESFKIMAQREP